MHLWLSIFRAQSLMRAKPMRASMSKTKSISRISGIFHTYCAISTDKKWVKQTPKYSWSATALQIAAPSHESPRSIHNAACAQ
jgi:hypothetical protein